VRAGRVVEQLRQRPQHVVVVVEDLVVVAGGPTVPSFATTRRRWSCVRALRWPAGRRARRRVPCLPSRTALACPGSDLMAESKPDIHGMSIVMVGSFNPAIYHSAWFTKFGLLPEEEGDDVQQQVILPDFAQFSLAWLQSQVTPDRFQLSTVDPESFNLLRDLAIGTFRILPHSPVSAIGINRDQHYRIASVQRWHEIGLTLAPANVWRPSLLDAGMRSLLIEGRRDDGYAGYVHVRVEPSVRVFPGVYIGVNDHFQLGEQADEVIDAERAIDVLETQWDDVLQRAPSLVDVVLSVKASGADQAEAKRRADEHEKAAAVTSTASTGNAADGPSGPAARAAEEG
jgi:hypothetical protein